MKNFNEFLSIVPEIDLWQYLKLTDKPIVLYGMGDGADKIINQLDKYGLTVSDIFASDEFVRGHSFHGHIVKKYSEICEKYNNCIILLCFAAKTAELFSKFKLISEKYEFFAPDVPAFGSDIFDLNFFNDNINEIENAWNLFADDDSREVYENIILYKLTGKITYLLSADSDKAQAFTDILTLSNNESFLDLGAYTGDTVKELLLYTNETKSILAVEPDTKSYKKLCSYLADLDNAKAVNCGISCKNEIKLFSNRAGRMSSVGNQKGIPTQFRTIDYLCNEFTPTYIKMDLEGEEESALLGAENTLKSKPKLLVSAYHRSKDIFALPILINKINSKYCIYLRKHTYIPAWDINIYAK